MVDTAVLAGADLVTAGGALISDVYGVGPTEIAIVGDSRAQDSVSIGAGGILLPNQGLASWIQALGGGRYSCPADLNFSNGGDQVSAVLARIAPILACRAKEVVLIVGTNNSSSSVAMTTTIADYTSLLNQLRLARKRVTLLAEYPRGAAAVGGNEVGSGTVSSGYSQSRLSGTPLAYHGQLRRWLLDVASRMPGVQVVDVWPGLGLPGSTTGDAFGYTLRDSLHLAPIGGRIVAGEIVKALNNRYPLLQSFGEVNNSFLYNATDNPRGCLIANPSMIGSVTPPTSNGDTGNTASSWTNRRVSMTGYTGTVAWSKVTGTAGPLKGQALQQVVLAGTTNSTSNPELQLSVDISTSNFTAGDIVQGGFWAELDAGLTGIGTVQAYMQLNDASSTYTYQSQSRLTAANAGVSGAKYPYPAEAFTGENALFHSLPRFVIPSGLVLARFAFSVRMNESDTVALTARFGRAFLNKVP